MSELSKISPERRLSGPYRSVVLVLCATTALGGVAAVILAFVGAYALDAAVVLTVASGVLFAIAQATQPTAVVDVPTSRWRARLRRLLRPERVLASVGLGFVAIDIAAEFFTRSQSSLLSTILAAAGCAIASAAAVLAAHYFGGADVAQLPEAPALRRGARVVAWLLAMIAAEVWASRLGYRAALWSLHAVVLAIVALACIELLSARRDDGGFPVELRIVSALGRRANLLASLLDTAQQELGIDLRSTWALAVVRRFAQPLVAGLCVLGWLSTGVTIINANEVGLVERFGATIDRPPLSPGIHVHWPWPVDRIQRISTSRIRTVPIGAEGAADLGPEDVLWAKPHASREYTLLLGNGNDLITVDAAIQYRIRDAHAWLYDTQNPSDALRAIGYRVVMRATVDRTLADAMSENVATLTASIRGTIQEDANTLGLGVEIVDFTIAGMHPPVAVAADYQAVVSAELAKVTAIVNAQAARNQSVPAAEAAAFIATSVARADGAAAIAKAAADAWSFRALEAQYTSARDEYRFRRRLEALEQVLVSRRFTIVDARIMRDGGELWLTR
jgi:regulator of protease activity HflC (stomatin/prohibitin superfamily)